MSDRPIATIMGFGTGVTGGTTTFGGLGLAAYLGSKGYAIRFWLAPGSEARTEHLEPIREAGGLEVEGYWSGRVPFELITSDAGQALEGATVAAVSGVPELHRALALATAPFLEPGQIVLLAPGRTGGALEFRAGLEEAGAPHGPGVRVAETISYIANSRLVGPARVFLGPEKLRLPAAALPATDTAAVLETLSTLPFVAAPDVLSTSLTNFGPSNHAVPLVLNAGWVESRPGAFLHYVEGCTPAVSRVIERFDAERVGLAQALGAETVTLQHYLNDSCEAVGDDIATAIKTSPMYAALKAPGSLEHPFLVEDVTSGVVPMAALGRAVGFPMPVMESIIVLASALLGRDLEAEGRGLARLGLAGLDAEGIRRKVRG
ncbi:MAG: NAD/NADP octopine/nopaline dehydrogenase family protein [Chloroflexi bacterium]|nr:NAD/NADP octopine/nopaline dehydrogenase family protein [Chloroflexota bacterium]